MRPWSGRAVQKARAYVATHHLPGPCGRCQAPIDPLRDRWVVGHIKSRAAYPELTWDPKNWRAECRACSDRSAQSSVQEKAARDALRAHGIDPDATPVLPATEADAEPPLLPVSLPEGSDGSAQLAMLPELGPALLPERKNRPRLAELDAVAPAAISRQPLHIDPALVWNPAALAAFPWIVPYLDLPDSATPPLAMTPPPADAVGSYGPALIEWARVSLGVKVRWWQGLVLVRILEHRADGSLCWAEVVKSCSRRSGKSVVVRLLALWRLVFAPGLFKEEQLIVHSASTLRIAKEPMRYAGRWAGSQDHLEVYTNNNNYAIEDKRDGHRWIVVPPDKTAGLDTCNGIIDEAWKCLPEVVDDDLEPSLMERVSPQLLLVSTAHRRATSLMRSRIGGALAGDEDQAHVLLLLWAAQPDQDPGVVETWRSASPHWSPEREAYLRRKYGKAVRGEQDPEFDDPDPMEGFRAQYLNMWPLAAATVARGTALIGHETVWAQLRSEPPRRAPDAVAIESWFEAGVSVASAWRQADGSAIVRVVEASDIATAVHLARATGYRGRITAGASLLTDPAFTGLPTTKGQGSARATVLDLARVLADGELRHDGSPHLAEQVLAIRTVPGGDGPRLASQHRTDAVKAAMWALTAARARPAPSARRKRITQT